MNKIAAETAIHDKTFNNLKASRASLNDLYSQNITRIANNESMEVFSTLTELRNTVRDLTARLVQVETKLAELVVDEN
jgi:formylmethanofuran dehydrogenase subunit E-like metal-binding protein